MANKTILFRCRKLSGRTDLVAELSAQAAGTVANGAGDACTEVGSGLFSFTYTEGTVGWLDLSIVDTEGNVVAQGGKVYIASDTEGTYIADNQAGLFVELTEIQDLLDSFPPFIQWPVLGSIGERVAASKIVVYVDETLLVPITVLDANLDPVDLSGLELVFTVKDDRKQVVLTIEDDDIAISGEDNNVASVTLPDDVSEKVGRALDWSIRNVAGNVVLGFGEIEIRYAP